MSSNTSINRRILRAVGAEVLGQFLSIAIRLILVPLFLSAWGVQAYGEWLILTAVVAWFGLGDLGGQLYFVNRMTAAWAVGRREEFQRVLSTGLLLFVVSSSVMFSCVVFGLTWSPMLTWFGLQEVQPDVAKPVLLIMALRFLVALPVGLLMGVYRATGAQAMSVMYGNLVLVIQFFASAVALLAGAGMLVLATLEVLPLLAVAFIVCWDLRKRLPSDIKLMAIGHADYSIFRAAISPSLHFLGIQLAMATMIQGSVIAVANALGPVEVAIFSTMRTVSNIISRFLAMFSHSAWPEFTRLESTGQTHKLTYLFRSILVFSLLGGLVYLVVVQTLGETLFHWWLKNKLPYDSNAMFLTGCLVILTNMWTLGGNLLMATNKHEEYARLQLPVNFFALALCYRGATEYGLSGAFWGVILGQSIPMVGIVILFLKRNGWGMNATCLFRLSVGSSILLPMCLDFWIGLAAIAVLACLTLRQLGWREIPIKVKVKAPQ